MNDLPLSLEHTQIDLYADDATQYVPGRFVAEIEVKLNSQIRLIIQ